MKIVNFAIFVFIFLIYSCNEQLPNEEELLKNQQKTQSIAEVETSVVTQNVFYKETLSSGKLLANEKAEILFRTGGIIEYLDVKNGETAKKGSLLVKINSESQQLKLHKAQARLAQANTDRESKLSEYLIRSTDTASLSTQIKETVELSSGYTSAKLDLEEAQNELAYTQLIAPFFGRVANLKHKKYETAKSGEVFCTLISSSAFYAEFQVMESELINAKLGTKVKISPLADTITYWGKITEINPIVDENGMISLKASLQTHSKNIFDGMNAEIVIRRQFPQMLLIPKRAKVIRSGKDVVFTYENGVAKWKYVTVFGENSSQYAISEGLNTGDTIIISNNMNLSHDAFVTKVKGER